jgi:hypothetical protein
MINLQELLVKIKPHVLGWIGTSASGIVAHSALSGLTTGDDHTQYLSTGRHDTTTRHTLGTVVPHDAHSALSGLTTGDDHTQYLLANGTRLLSGNLTLTGHILPNTTDYSDIGSSTKLFRKGWLSELDAILFAENTITLLGGWFYVTKDQGDLLAAVAAAATTINFGRTMTLDNFVIFRSLGQVEYVLIGTLVSGTTYNVTRNLDGTGANDWPVGTVFAVLGSSGDGRIELNAYDTPRLSMIKQGATYDAQTELVRIGDLVGMPGVAGNPWGIYIGDASSYLKYDGTALTIAGNGAGLTSISGGNITTGTIAVDKLTSGTLGVSKTLTVGAVANSAGRIEIATDASNNATIKGIFRSALGVDTVQAYFGSDGRIYTGNNAVVLGNDGIVIDALSGNFSNAGISWKNGAALCAEITTQVDLGVVTSFGINSAVDILIQQGSTFGLTLGRFGSGSVEIQGANVYVKGNLSINNSTLVTNLNADMLDGLHGSQFLRNDLANQSVQAGLTIATQDNANEGGEFHLAKPPNSALWGHLAFDLFLNTLRIFENGGTYRGVYLDVTKASTYITSRLWHDTILQGTAFPASPFTGQQFFRTDLGWTCYWDGTYWLTVAEYSSECDITRLTTAGSGGQITGTVRSDRAIYVSFVTLTLYVYTTNNASNYWSVGIRGINQAVSAATDFYTASTADYGAATFLRFEGSADPTAPSNRAWFGYYATKTGAPGDLIVRCRISYRMIVT